MSISSVNSRASKKSIMSIIIMKRCKSQVLELLLELTQTAGRWPGNPERAQIFIAFIARVDYPEQRIFYKITVTLQKVICLC